MAVDPAFRRRTDPTAERFPRPEATGTVVRADQEAMRRFLVEQRPTSGNEALRMLRSAFPDTPLGERVKAAESARAGGF